ncbi:MFS domain-containing protein [Fusarium keratoplasticum]|uniref:MFS domain-containing protein n=1 Tax=Fusarium keratoplasticum TaxID=1328300 RepID=A0ACC0R322_9HYPO|nr:MFS domain-containing protein [Fusarium keratoplasticum]KAI8671380.1 MFS domain-containing protein [Fusarium keratoplasticum]KAI8678609.1 MFS domain-containing protein [Fusarium keratoplasticum]
MTGTLTSGRASAPSETSPLLGDRNSGDAINGDAENGRVNGNHVQEPVKAKMHLILPAVGIGVYMVAIDQLLTVATYAKIGNELNALNNTSWIATAYFLTLTSFQPLYGKLSDIFGRKPCLLFAYTIFALGCLGCGLAQSMVQLCAARAVAGIGGGGMNAVVSILLSDLVPLRERGMWQGCINILWAAGTSTGAPLGGLLADSVGWRWSFLGQVPLCFVAFIAVYFVLDLPPVSHDHWLTKVRQIDFLGAFTLVIAVVALLAGLDSGSNLGWSHIITIIALSLAPVFFGLFLFVEMKVAPNPFAPGHIIFDRSLFACYLVNFFGVAGQMAILFFMPLFFQAVQGLTATQSGALLVPGMIAGVIASLLGGWIIKRTEKFYAITVSAYALLLVAALPLGLSVWFRSTTGEVVGLVATSLGAGCGITTTLVGLLANAAVEDTAVVVACSYLFRSLGSSIGISTGSAVLQQVLRTQLASRLPNGDEAREIEENVRQSLDYIKELPPHLAAQVRSSYQVATLGALALITIYLAVSFLTAFWIKERPLKR